jgi:hypothetical protein
MNVYQFLALILLVATSARANLYVPKAKLAGETVYVRLTKDDAVVNAAFEFEQWDTIDDKIIYFPIFASETENPIGVLSRAGFELEIAGKKIGIATPSTAPRKFDRPVKGVKVCWFAANLDDLVDESNVDIDHRIVIKVRYAQPLIAGVFYYLPIITGSSEPDQEKRSWKYQMHARSAARLIRVHSKDSDSELLGETTVVYLKDGQVVMLQ